MARTKHIKRFDSTISRQGGLQVPPTVVDAATYSLADGDEHLSVTRTEDGTCTITLPTDQLVDGRRIRITDTGNNANTNNITVTAEAAATEINHSTGDYTINGDANSIDLWSNGTHWFLG